jgi:DNA-binding transcriptional regulator PaaX
MLYMGKMEDETRRRRRLGSIQQAILGLILMSGALAVQRIAPEVLRSLKRDRKFAHQFTYRARSQLSQLREDGLVSFEERGGLRYARITNAGRNALMVRGNLLAQWIQKPKRWDGRWRVVIFDIPERRRNTRDTLRRMMRSFGFYRLQDSVWVHPYDAEDVIALAKTELKLGTNVLYMIVEHIENDQRLKEEFLLR